MPAMTSRTVTLPAHLFRWLFAPALMAGLYASLSALLQRRTRRVDVPPMSDEWLNNLAHRSHSDPWPR